MKLGSGPYSSLSKTCFEHIQIGIISVRNMAFDNEKKCGHTPQITKIQFKLNEIRFVTLLIFVTDMFRTHSDWNIFGSSHGG